ncbi:MAG: TlpA disulfide reductase family protein, partial [Bacteroidales bacterium]|nr:TlpA disulfide reductase family protein [Bacteroidales bacterium]
HIGKEAKLDTVAAMDAQGVFNILKDISTPDFYKLQFDNSNAIMMILYPGDNIELRTDASDFFNKLTIKGSEQTLQVYTNQKVISSAKQKLDSINNLLAREKFSSQYDSILIVSRLAYEQIELDKDKTLSSFILKNPCSLAVLFLIESLPLDKHINAYTGADSCLFLNFPDNFFVKNFHNSYTGATKTAIGSVAPDFTLPDSAGIKISLSSLRGKYVLVDFWASWCGPCKKELPNLIKLYKDFKSSKFEILGVSLDKTRAAWVGAIRSEKLSWIHVSDLKYWQSEVVPLYHITGIPHMILLDPEGKIIAKNLRGEELYHTIKDILK